MMKRFAMIIVVVLLAITSAFSVAAEPAVTKTKVSLDLTDADVTAYRVGFTTKTNLEANKTWKTSINDMTDLPAAIDAVKVGYQKSSGYIYNDTHVLYYKIRGSKGATIELTADSALISGKKRIDYTVTVNGEKDVVNTADSTSKWVSDPIDVDPATGCTSGSFPVVIKSNEAVNATQIGTYTSTLTLTVKAS